MAVGITIEQAFRQRLKAAVQSLTGSRVRPQQLTEQELTIGLCVIYSVRSDTELARTLDDTEDTDELGKAIFQVDCLGKIGKPESYEDTREIKGLVKEAFDEEDSAGDWNYTDENGQPRTVRVQECRVEDNADDMVPPVAALEMGIPALSCLVIVIYEHA